MKTKDTKADLRAWMDRWKIVNEFEREELRNTPMATKVRQLAAMMRMARQGNWQTSTEEEHTAIRERWNRLRQVISARR